MKDILLSWIRGYCYFFDQESVLRVMARADAPALIRRAGVLLLPLPEGENAEVCPIHLICTWAAPQAGADDHFLILRRNGRLLALPMQGKGRPCSIRLDSLPTLPPAFTGQARRMVPELLLNGSEVILRLNLEELLRVMDKIAYLRKKKLQKQLAAAGPGN